MKLLSHGIGDMVILHPNDRDQAIVESVGNNLRTYSFVCLFVLEIYWLVGGLTIPQFSGKCLPVLVFHTLSLSSRWFGVCVDCTHQIFEGMHMHHSNKSCSLAVGYSLRDASFAS